MRRYLHLACAAAVLFACTNAGIYSTGEGGPNGPAASFAGRVCVPVASGDVFPVKVLFAVEDSTTLQASVWGAILQGIGAFLNAQHPTTDSLFLELVAFDTFANGLLGKFTSLTTNRMAVSTALGTVLPSFRETGPVSLRAPLDLAAELLAADMQTSCPGVVGRTHYVVVIVYSDQDATCQDPSIAAGLNAVGTGVSDPCLNYLDGGATSVQSCGFCEVLNSAAALKAVGDKYGAGQVTLQPIYISAIPADAGSSDPAYQEGVAIANVGGTTIRQPGPVAVDVQSAIASINTAALQKSFVLKHAIAFNRNALARGGKLLLDSDGDGLSDDEEVALGTDPRAYDSDHDCVGDGVKVKYGLPRGQSYVSTSCQLCVDSDNDGLSDCEEEILKTQACMGDTDGDYLPDLVELLSGTNPLIAEGLQDTDRDGATNITEVLNHTDPNAPDLAFAAQYGYVYTQADAPPTDDGRACYDLRIENIQLLPTLSTDAGIPDGVNQIYLYLQFGLPNDSAGAGFGALVVQPVQRLPKGGRLPAGLIGIDAGIFLPAL